MPIASHRKNYKTFPICVLAKFQSHPIENMLRQFQIVSAKFRLHLVENLPGRLPHVS